MSIQDVWPQMKFLFAISSAAHMQYNRRNYYLSAPDAIVIPIHLHSLYIYTDCVCLYLHHVTNLLFCMSSLTLNEMITD